MDQQIVNTDHINKEIDIQMSKHQIKKTEKKGILYNIVKYCAATLPIIVPFIVCMIITGNDILVSIFGTLTFIVFMILCMAIWYFRNTEVKNVD